MADVVLVHLWGVHNEYPPLGLGYLAAIAIEEGLSAKIIDPTTDPSFSLEKFSKILQKENPKFVCFGLYTSYVIESFKMAKTARATMPNAIIIAGGPHANATLSQTLKDCLEFDVLVHGEGEETFREIIQNKAFGEIKGILFRKNGRIVKNPLRPFIQNLDSLPFPARQLFSKNYVYDVCFQEKPVANIVTSRGCPYACIFCSKETFGTVYRQRSVQSAVEEVREIIEVHKFKELFFFEDVFTMNKQWVMDFCNALKREKINVPWKCLGRVDRVDEAMLNAMKQSGCHTVFFGVESGNEEILQSVGKGVTKDKIRQGVTALKKADLDAGGYFVIGLPEENEQTVNESISFATELELDWAIFYIATAFPGTGLYNFLPEKYKKQWSRLQRYYPNSNQTETYSKNTPVSLCELSGTELVKLKEKAIQNFYFNPSYLRRVLSKPNSPTFAQKLSHVKRGATIFPEVET